MGFEEAEALKELVSAEDIQSMHEFAMKAPDPYNPYSRYGVRAVVETIDDKAYFGINIENANYTLTKHAEEVAVLQAIMDGAIQRNGREFIKRIFVSGFGGIMAPCGGCRQFISEFSFSGTVWVGYNRSDKTARIEFFKNLLPLPFGPSDLGA